MYQVTDGPNTVGAPEGKNETVSAKGRPAAKRRQMPQTEKQHASHRVSERNHKERQVTKRKRVATPLHDNDNVDLRKEKPYENRAVTRGVESGMMAEHGEKLTAKGGVRVLSV